MTEPPPETHPNPPYGRPPAAGARWNWKRATRRFTAEFLVVVTGVLVALALNAWWQDREDIALEKAYLQQLSVDLEMNEQLARTTLDNMDEHIWLPRSGMGGHMGVSRPPRDPSQFATFNGQALPRITRR